MGFHATAIVLTFTTFNHASAAALKSKSILEMVPVPAGIYWIGCDKLKDGDCSEKPGNNTHIQTFQISKYEITQEQYQQCVQQKKCSSPQSDFEPKKMARYPVVNVTWNQADRFCKWLGMSLPNDVEWEASARGQDARIYSWGDTPPDCKTSNSNYKCDSSLKPVGSFKKI
jgi:sulfatase modifying factor 1